MTPTDRLAELRRVAEAAADAVGDRGAVWASRIRWSETTPEALPALYSRLDPPTVLALLDVVEAAVELRLKATAWHKDNAMPDEFVREYLAMCAALSRLDES